jgi:hypothetical protein
MLVAAAVAASTAGSPPLEDVPPRLDRLERREDFDF